MTDPEPRDLSESCPGCYAWPDERCDPECLLRMPTDVAARIRSEKLDEILAELEIEEPDPTEEHLHALRRIRGAAAERNGMGVPVTIDGMLRDRMHINRMLKSMHDNAVVSASLSPRPTPRHTFTNKPFARYWVWCRDLLVRELGDGAGRGRGWRYRGRHHIGDRHAESTVKQITAYLEDEAAATRKREASKPVFIGSRRVPIKFYGIPNPFDPATSAATATLTITPPEDVTTIPVLFIDDIGLGKHAIDVAEALTGDPRVEMVESDPPYRRGLPYWGPDGPMVST